MDLYCSDKKLSELSESPLGDFLDSDVFTPPVSSSLDAGFGLDSGSSTGMDTNWLDTFFEDDPVLNDRMISDALQPAPGQQGVQSEHSYSLHQDNDDGTLDLSKTSHHNADMKDIDLEMTAVNPNNMTLTGHTTIPTANYINIKQEPLDLSLDSEMTTVTVTRSTNPQTLLKQPTIILATTSSSQQQHNAATATLRQVLPKVEIKMEPHQQLNHHHHHHHTTQQQQQQQQQQQRFTTTTTHSLMSSPEHSTESFDSLSLPPTPPSSTNSDSDGCDRSPPCSPHRSSRHHRPASPIIQQPFFMSPIPTSGVLVLSEEEKRTLISEGYPIPGKLPLTKQEEKNLKKIRRKIKNKISAQESRRKKKEYVETLERKVEAFSQENGDLRKKVDNLQNNNQSLMSQLHKLQSIVTKIAPTNSHSNTCLMVLVLCFAVMLGSWSPMSLSMGYSSSTAPSLGSSSSVSPSSYLPSSPSSSSSLSQYSPSPDMLAQAVGSDGGGARGGVAASSSSGDGSSLQASTVQAGLDGMGPEPTYGPYATPNMRSRVLLSHEDEEKEEEFGPHAPFSYKWLLGGIFGGGCAASDDHAAVPGGQSHQPTLPKVNIMDVETEINQTGGGGGAGANVGTATPTDSSSRQPDIAVTTSSKPINATS